MSESNEIPRLLKDGSEPMASDALLKRCDDLGIAYSTLEHPPVFTVEEAKQVRGRVDGAHSKNLFLRNKKGKMWLVTCLEDRDVKLKELAVAVGAKHFSFARASSPVPYRHSPWLTITASRSRLCWTRRSARSSRSTFTPSTTVVQRPSQRPVS